MLKIFAEGLLIVYIFFCLIFLVAGNICVFWSWVKEGEKRRRMGVQYYYLKFWGNPGEYSKEELEKLHQMLERYEKEYNENS